MAEVLVRTFSWSVETSLLCRSVGGVRGGACARGRVARANVSKPLKNSSMAISSLVAVVVACLGIGADARAAGWYLEPRVEAGYKYSDNYRLDLPGSEVEVSGALVDALLSLSTVSPRSSFVLTPRVRISYFPGETDQNANDYYLGINFDDKTQRRRAGIRVDLSSEDVVTSELPSASITSGLGNPDALDSGQTLENNRRDLIEVTPNFSYDLSQRYRLDLDAHYVDANFERSSIGGQLDFSDIGASVALGFVISPRSTVLLRALASRYETTSKTDGYGGEVEWTTNYSELSKMYVRLGVQKTSPERGPSDTQVLGGLGGRWSSQRNKLFLDLTRSVGPVSAGTVVERHQLRLRLAHDVTERVAWIVSARAFRDEGLEPQSTYPTRKYAVGEAGVEWRVQRAWSITGTYNYYWQEYANDPTSASANGIVISVVYEPKRAD